MTTIDTPVAVTAVAKRRNRLAPRPKWWLYIVLALGFVAMIFPFIWMILGSFKTNAEIRSNPLGFLPEARRWTTTRSCSDAWTSRPSSPTVSLLPFS